MYGTTHQTAGGNFSLFLPACDESRVDYRRNGSAQAGAVPFGVTNHLAITLPDGASTSTHSAAPPCVGPTATAQAQCLVSDPLTHIAALGICDCRHLTSEVEEFIIHSMH